MNPTTTPTTTTLLSAFDRICIINLPERSDRRRAVARELRRLGAPVDGARVRVVEAIRPDGPAGFPSTGAHGCYLSHLKVLRQAQADGVQRLLVLEDDVMFGAAMAQSAALTARLRDGDWQLAYPGHVQAARPGPLRWEPTSEPLVCAHCYAVQGDALPVLIGFLEACLQRPEGHPLGGPMHFDGALSMLRAARPELRTLIASRSLAGQRSSRSDIAGPSWIDRLPAAALARTVRNGWRRLAGAF
jgi:glycosyl transferase, family 25